ncbi:MAG: branched-chain amino acid aminotransferase [Cyclobacteriaceae bacterium]|nr:branched-chain amino acid aminotransferase [Cyclobacteriaceae bacterium]
MKINVNRVEKSRIGEVDFDNISFGKIYSDHMFRASYKNGQWNTFDIIPFGSLSISPASQTLHYGVSVFEGMKAYKNEQGQPVLFRPLENQRRLNRSAERLCIPALPEEIFMEGLTQLLKMDQAWIPGQENTALYVRPFIFSTEEYIGIKTSDSFDFLIITSPVGAYYSAPVKVKIEMEFARAVRGGTGYAKAAGNYAGSLYPAKLGQQQGYDQLIWTDGQEHKYIEEAGTMNLMFVIDDVLVTPELTDTLLHGITRDSILTLARDMGIPVEERKITVNEVVSSLQQGNMTDAFGVGTAATLTHISVIGYEGTDYILPPVQERTISNRLKETLENIKKGRAEDKFGWVVPVI